MRRALTLARRGCTSPNPMVGAVVVKDSVIVGEGFHPYAGAPHAEVFALQAAGDAAHGADLYVTLEPCCHFGKTPPCADAVISAGIKRVFAAMQDPFPKVAGGGLSKIRQAGIEVHVGLLEEEARCLNESFTKYHTTGLPFVTLKMAMTLDGKIATREGDSKWISCATSRQYVHRLRCHADVVGVGVGTLLADDPKLTVRGMKCRTQPRRLVIDSLAKTPPTAHLLNSAGGEVLIAATRSAPEANVEKLKQAGARIITIGEGPKVDLKELVKAMGSDGIQSVLLEGGGELAASAIEAQIVDKVLIFVAPKIIGGRSAKTPVEGLGIASMSAGISLQNMSVRKFGCDLAIEGYPEYKAEENS